jgi:hypothetical protein
LCICAPDPPAFKAPSLEVEFPDFEYPSYMFGKQDDGYVFKQTHEPGPGLGRCEYPGGCIDHYTLEECSFEGATWTEGAICGPTMDYTSCSIPCVVKTITLTTSGCCLFGGGFSFTAIGAGTISLSGCGSVGECADADFGCSINGSGTSVFVPDCESVSVDITPPVDSPDGCCSCCLINSYGTLLSSSTPFAIYKQRSLKTGVQKTYINKKKLVEKISKARRR